MRRTTVFIGIATTALVVTTGIRLATGNRNDATTPGPAESRTTTTAKLPAPSGKHFVEPVDGTVNTSPISATITSFSKVESGTEGALRFLDLDEELFPPVTPETARALTESIASDSARATLGQQAFDHQTQIVAKGDLAGLKLRIAPIVHRTRDCTATACTVDVYFLRLWSFPNQGALDDYATVEIHVVHEHDQWRLESSTLTDGPYPAGRFTPRPTASLNAKTFETILNGYTDNETTP